MEPETYTISRHLFRRTMRERARRLEDLRERYFVTNPQELTGPGRRQAIARLLRRHGVRAPGDEIVQARRRTGGSWRVYGVEAPR